jgi:tetratricopeptide (TPR) repeat protein
MRKIFISYRRSDTQMVAGRLRESLARRLGEDAIFRDKDSIAPGVDWTKAIDQSLTGEVAVLALIGPGWASAQDDAGRRRLDDPAGWNRVELERALERCQVIPLRVDDAKMPQAAELPESLQALARLQALRLRDDDWDSDVERILRALGAQERTGRVRRRAVALAAVVAIAAGGAGYWWLGAGGTPPRGPAAAGDATGSSYRAHVRAKLHKQQDEALKLLFSPNATDRAKAIGLVDANLAAIDQALQAFPEDVYLQTLAGYAAKNVFESSRGTDFLSPEQRKKYLARARMHFVAALKLDPKDPGALNGMGNMLFYEGKYDEAIRYHEQALALTGGQYPAAKHDLDLVKRVKSGEIQFRP